MSADTLRKASAKIRADWSGMRGATWEREGAFHLAVADWLDACALVLEVSPTSVKAHALTVARAYLGGES